MLGANLGLILTMILWGAQVPLISFVSDRYDPYLLAAIRYCGAVPFFLFALKVWEPGPIIAGYPLRWVIALGAAIAAFGTLYTAGVAFSHPVTAAVLGAMAPAVAALVAWAMLGVRPNRTVMVSLVLVACGGILATVDLSHAGTFRLRGGEILIVLASVTWSWYSIEAQRRLPGASQIRITGLSLIFAALFLLPIYGVASLFGATHGSLLDVTSADLSIFALFVIGVAVVGIVLWNLGVARLGVVPASMYINLIPIVALLVSMLLGYVPRAEQVAGGTLVLAGVLLVQISRLFDRSPKT